MYQECEDGLQMVGWRRFMVEQWLCVVSVWYGRERDVRLECSCFHTVMSLSTAGLHLMVSAGGSL